MSEEGPRTRAKAMQAERRGEAKVSTSMSRRGGWWGWEEWTRCKNSHSKRGAQKGRQRSQQERAAKSHVAFVRRRSERPALVSRIRKFAWETLLSTGSADLHSAFRF